MVESLVNKTLVGFLHKQFFMDSFSFQITKLWKNAKKIKFVSSFFYQETAAFWIITLNVLTKKENDRRLDMVNGNIFSH